MFILRPSAHNCLDSDPSDAIDQFLHTFLGRMDPRTQIESVEGGYNIHINVPGVDPESIKVGVENGVLSIEASRNEDASHTFFQDGFTGRWKLPETVDVEGITAACKNGILTVHVPVNDAQQKKVKTIKVTT